MAVLVVAFVSLASSAESDDVCFYERMAIKELEERCWFSPCLRRPGPPRSDRPMLVNEGPVEEPMKQQPKRLLNVFGEFQDCVVL